jgi:triphosphoribosyl-dephospho-CoA synthase
VDIDISTYVGNCASLAALLEVSAYPKPGNIHRLSDFPETSYEHFLAGGVALGSVMGKLAERSSKTRDRGEVRLGEGIREGIDEMFRWQSGGNTHLGIILLCAPLSAGAGAALASGVLEVEKLREYTTQIISEATPHDSVNIYAAIDRAMSNENLGSADELDVKDNDSSERIIRENITPMKVFELCKDRDMICREWVTGFSTVFETGYSTLKKRITEGASINNATIDTFLKILSENPDSLIMRKMGEKAAKHVSEAARRIIEAGGSESKEGNKMLWSLDEELKKENGKLNPGTTADLTAASLFVLVLSGWRP